MNGRVAGILLLSAGFLGFGLAFFAFDPSRVLLDETEARVRKLERTAADLKQTMSDRITRMQGSVVDVAPAPLNARHYSVVDNRAPWEFVSAEPASWRVLYRDTQGASVLYGWKAVFANEGAKPVDVCAYVRVLDGNGESVDGSSFRIALPPMTSKQFRGLLYDQAVSIGSSPGALHSVASVSIVLDPAEVKRIVDHDKDRLQRGVIRRKISPYLFVPEKGFDTEVFECY